MSASVCRLRPPLDAGVVWGSYVHFSAHPPTPLAPYWASTAVPFCVSLIESNYYARMPVTIRKTKPVFLVHFWPLRVDF